MKVSQAVLKSWEGTYQKNFGTGDNCVKFTLKRMNALKRAGIGMLWGSDGETAQELTLKECVIGWDVTDDADKPLLFNFYNLVNFMTVFTDVGDELTEHLLVENKIKKPAKEANAENFTPPPLKSLSAEN